MAEFFSIPANKSVLFTVGDLARRLDVSPSDVLDDLFSAGVGKYWHEGRAFNRQSLTSYLAQRHFFDPVPELEVELTPSQIQWLSAMADIDPASLVFDLRDSDAAISATSKPLRKFVGSQDDLQDLKIDKRVGRIG